MRRKREEVRIREGRRNVDCIGRKGRARERRNMGRGRREGLEGRERRKVRSRGRKMGKQTKRKEKWSKGRG